MMGFWQGLDFFFQVKDEENEAKEIKCLSQEADAEDREFPGSGTPSLHSSQWRKRSLFSLP